MRSLTSHTYKTENIGLGATQVQSGSSISSFASTSPLTEIKAADLQPIPSTSSLSGRQIDSTSFKQVDLRPLSERTRHTSFIESVDLNGAIGSAVGIGALEVKKKLFPDHNIDTQVNIIVNSTAQDSDGINNPLK